MTCMYLRVHTQYVCYSYTMLVCCIAYALVLVMLSLPPVTLLTVKPFLPGQKFRLKVWSWHSQQQQKIENFADAFNASRCRWDMQVSVWTMLPPFQSHASGKIWQWEATGQRFGSILCVRWGRSERTTRLQCQVTHQAFVLPWGVEW